MPRGETRALSRGGAMRLAAHLQLDDRVRCGLTDGFPCETGAVHPPPLSQTRAEALLSPLARRDPASSGQRSEGQLQGWLGAAVPHQAPAEQGCPRCLTWASRTSKEEPQ